MPRNFGDNVLGTISSDDWDNQTLDPRFNPKHRDYDRAADVRRKLQPKGINAIPGAEDFAGQRRAGDAMGVTVFNDNEKVGPRQTGFSEGESTQLDDEQRNLLANKANQLQQGEPMYAKFGGREFVQYSKPKLSRYDSQAILRINELKRAREDGKAESKDRRAHQIQMAEMEGNRPLKLENARSQNRLAEAREMRELEEPDRLLEREERKEDRNYNRNRQKIGDDREQENYDWERAQRATPEQAKAQKVLDNLPPDFIKRIGYDAKARAYFNKLMKTASGDEMAGEAFGQADPDAIQQVNEEYMNSPVGAREIKRLVNTAKASAGSFTTSAGLEKALAKPLIALARKIKDRGGDPKAFIEDVLEQIRDAVPEETFLGMTMPFNSGNAVRGVAQDTVDNYGE